MVNIKVKIEGLDRLKANLRKYPSISAPLIDKAIKTSIMDIRGKSMSQTPVDTGRLRSSHETSFGRLRGEVGPTAYYGIYVHEGTYKMRARPFLRIAVEQLTSKINQNFKDVLELIMKKIA